MQRKDGAEQRTRAGARSAVGLLLVASIVGGGLILVPNVAADQPMTGAAWPQAKRDGPKTSRATVNGPAQPVQRWTYNAGSAIVSGPVIGADGTIYIGTDSAQLRAVKPDGTGSWTYDMPEGRGAPTYAVLTNRNRVTVGAQGGLVVGLNLDGKEGWRFDTRNAPYGTSDRQIIRSHPVLASNYSHVLIGTDTGNLYELDDGEYKGVRRAGDSIRAGAAVSPDGSIYWTSIDRTLYAGSASGGDKWRFTLDGPVSATPAVAADGTVYVATEAGTVFAVRADGSERWRAKIGGGKPARSSPSIGPDGTIYAGSDDGRLYAIDPGSGAGKWSFGTSGAITASPTVGANGLVYVGSNDGTLYVISPDGAEVSRFAAGGAIDFASPAIGQDGTLYIGTRGGSLYALREGGPGFAGAATATASAPAPATPGASPTASPTPTPGPTAVPPTPTAPAGPLPTDRVAPVEGAIYFSETGHNLRGSFLSYFVDRGGLEVFGYPISEEFQEDAGEGNGRTRTVQYFQRARMELHPENAGTPYEVQLGLLGAEILARRGWLR